ncbi:LytR/AlgR family response regulator transcription factor [Acetobacterium malicum]|uniref:LytR/AlgR family response regulator transcription factor n=1 Tax=Acetobacterium malicum TaxID=52692 RepID=UPI0003FC8747|nr:LytTR family DNA-binding domain-containing protein [Acetobacterium dehalogenans]
MLKIAVCEDEEQHKKILVDLIGRYPFKTDYSLTTFQFGYELVAASNEGINFDMIFLDMRLDNEDGIDIANEIRKTDTEARIIITTSLIEYAVLGYSVNASDFLLKPFPEDKLFLVLEKLENDLKYSRSSFHEIEINNEKIFLKSDEILYFESLGRKIKVTTFDAEYEYYYTISALEKELDSLRFILCHRSYIVNLKNVKSIKTKAVVLKNGVMIPISPKRNQKVYDAFTRYMAGSME